MTPDAYDAADATHLAELVAEGAVTPDALLDIALGRSRALNPALNAVLSEDEPFARRLIAEGLPEGPFRGVPFLLKDIGCETPDFPYSNGSRLAEGTRTRLHSTVYLRLRAAGLVPFARTTCPEGAVGPATEAAVYGGPTRNPWDPTRTPGGSSGGAAAAVAAGIVPAAHGSDGGGSIRIPASNCGLVGFKPSRARIPDGPYAGEGWAGMAQDGVLTRTVRDTAALCDALAGPDLGAPYFPPPMAGTHLAAAGRAPRPLRVAVCDTAFDGEPVHAECRTAVRRAADLLAGLGHHVEAARPEVSLAEMMQAWTRIVACGTASWTRSAAARRGLDDPSALLEPATRGALRLAARVSGADYLDAVNAVHQFGREMAAFFTGHHILLSPALAEPPARIGRFAHSAWEDFEAYRNGPDGVFRYSPFTAAFNASGQPAISLPLHWSEDGLPVGVHLAAAMGEDETLISLAAQIEAAAPWAHRRPPVPA